MSCSCPRFSQGAAILLVALLLAPPAISQAADTKRPNVVLILADDLGYGDIGCYGATMIKTPNVDRLAKEGRAFMNAYTPSSLCSPTRYALMAGRYVWREPRHPKTIVSQPGGPLLFDRGRITLAKLFQKNGYATAAFGKWHLGFGEGDNPSVRYDFSQEEIKPGPNEAGFDYFFGMAANAINSPMIYIENHRFFGRKPGDKVEMIGRETVKPWSPAAEFKLDHVGGDIARQAVEYIENASDIKPFFLYIASNIPHHDITPSSDFVGKSGCGPYGDFIQELDAHVGLILEALKKKGVLDNTLIIFTSDNGGVALPESEKQNIFTQTRQAGHLTCATLRGGKGGIYEGGFRVPFIVRWPGRVPAGTRSRTMLCLNDVLATCANILGEKLPANAGEDSFDALAAWQGDDTAKVRDSVVLTSGDGIFALREGDWKLILRDEHFAGGDNRPIKNNLESQNELYDLAKDPSETRNLLSEQPDLVKQLKERLDQARQADHTRP
jgi:arylsulfatase A